MGREIKAECQYSAVEGKGTWLGMGMRREFKTQKNRIDDETRSSLARTPPGGREG